MKAISILLDDIIVVSQQAEVSECISEIFSDFFSVDIEVNYQKGKVFLNIPPTIRSEVFLQKNKIKNLLEEKLKRFNIKITKII